MEDRYAELRRSLEDAVLRGDNRTSASLRSGVASNEEVPERLRALVAKIREHAYRVTDEDISELSAHDDDDELFEIVVAGAVGASRERARAGHAALEEA